MSATDQPSEAELRAAYEAEIKRIGVDQILLEQVVTLINLGMRRTGLAPGTEDERDPAQVRLAVEAVRALLPLVDVVAGPQAEPIREALSQLQLAYVRLAGDGSTAGVAAGSAPGAGPGAPSGPGPARPAPGGAGAAGGPATSPPSEPAPGPDGPGPAQRSGRLWVPGQP